MIRKLKARMILLVLCGLLLASAGLVFAVNFINWQSLVRQSEGVLDTLAENNGQRPLPVDSVFPDFPDGTPPLLPFGQDLPWRALGGDLRSAASMISFFTVDIDADGQITNVNADRSDLYGEEDIRALTADILAAGRSAGRVDTLFYRLTERDAGRQLIVVDQRLAMQDALRVLRLTCLFAVAQDALLSLGAILLIRRMVKPVDEAVEKQKQFVWDASHELKTPLAVISANAELLTDEGENARPVAYIRSEVQRADRLIQSLLTLARMEKNAVPAERKQFNLSRAVMSVALPFESAVFEAGKTLSTQVPDGLTYTGDEEMIKQLCVILLSNAQKYSDDHGAITLRLTARGDRRILWVHNTGPAIPPEAQARIFDRFYRADVSHSSDVPGNGLGLAIARSIVDAHKGKITVHSAEGEGTAFTVVL